MTTTIDRVVACPDCHRYCSWCSWYAKNARSIGCGTTLKRSKPCEWDALKGTTCPQCGGTGRVRLIGRYEPEGLSLKDGDGSVSSGRD